MSTIQIPTVPATPLVLPGPVRYRVQTRTAWDTAWTSVNYVTPLEISEAASPGISNGRFKYDYGDIKREDVAAFANYEPTIQPGDFIRVQLLGAANSGLPGSTPQQITYTLWVGRVERVDYDVHQSDASTGLVQGDHFIHALGLEVLLDSRIVRGARIKRNDDGSFIDIERDLVFNEGDGVKDPGLEPLGNRSTAVETGKTHYVFSDEGELWTHEQIATYLLMAGPSGDEPFAPIRFRLAGQASDLLSQVTLPRVDVSGMTIREALDKLIDRRRGMGWTTRVVVDPDDEDNEIVEIIVFSTTDQDVSGPGGVIHPANQWATTVDLDDPLFIGAPRVTVKTELYDWIVVRGEHVVSMFSLSYADSTLEAGWSSGDESDYLGSTDADRRDERFDHVFRRFVVPSAWGLLVGNGEGSGSGAASPTILSDGSVLANSASSRDWGLRLLRQLPVVGPDGVEYQPPLAFVKYRNGNWIRADTDPAGAYVRPLDNALGVEVRCSPNHLLALNHWAGAGSASQQPDYDWQDMIVTVAMSCDNHLRVQERMPNSTTTGDEPSGQVLTVDVPGAEFWYRVPSTVTDAQSGSLVRAAGATNRILRDDSARLRRVLAMAKAWYARQRSTVRFDMHGIIPLAGVGTMISAVTTGTRFAPIGTVVTERRFDFRNTRTTVRTDYQELDLTRL